MFIFYIIIYVTTHNLYTLIFHNLFNVEENMFNKNIRSIALAALVSLSVAPVQAMSWSAGMTRINNGITKVKNGAAKVWSAISFEKWRNSKKKPAVVASKKKSEKAKAGLFKRIFSNVKLKNTYSKISGFFGYLFSKKISLKKHKNIIQELIAEKEQIQKNCDGYQFVAEMHKKEKDRLKDKLSGKTLAKMINCQKNINKMLAKAEREKLALLK